MKLLRFMLVAACVAVFTGFSLVDPPFLSGTIDIGDVVTLRDAAGEYEVLGRDESGKWVVEGKTPETGNILSLVDVYDVKSVVRPSQP